MESLRHTIMPGTTYSFIHCRRLGAGALHAYQLLGGRAKGLGAIRTGANGAENIVAIDSGGVAVAKRDLNGVVAHDSGGLRARPGGGHGGGPRLSGGLPRARG